MLKHRWAKILILALIVLFVGPLLGSWAAPSTTLRNYFWLERKLDSNVLRSLEPRLIGAGVLRPARVRVRGGFTLVLDPRDLVSWSLLRSEEWQPEVWESLAPALPKGGVFLDVGAHIGYFSFKAVRQTGPQGRAIAFEPNPETAQMLRDNISANRMENVTVEEIACTDREQELTLYAAPLNNTGASSLSKVNAAYGDGPAPRAFQVRGRPIDDVVQELGLTRVDAMKIDVEGAELQVLRGALGTLKRFHPRIVLEMVPSQLASFGTTPEDVASLIRSAGYTFGAPVSQGATDWEWSVAQSTVKMSDLSAARQLLKGFGGLAANNWRWTAGQFEVALALPEKAASLGAVLVGKFVFPEVSVRQLKTIRLSAKIGGETLHSETFQTVGEHEYRAEIPARLLGMNPTKVEFSVDKTMKEANQEMPELGLIVTSIALEPGSH